MFLVHLVFSLSQPQEVPLSGEYLGRSGYSMCLLTVSRLSLLLAPLRTEVGHIHSHIYIYFSISESAYIKNHGLIWISPTPIKENRVHSSLLLSLSVTAYLQYIQLFNVSIHGRLVSQFLTTTSVRNTFIIQSTIFVLFVFSLRVHNQNTVLQSYLVPPLFHSSQHDYVIHL